MKALWGTAICLVMITAACSVAPEGSVATTGSSATTELEQQLREYMDSASEYLVVIDRDNCFWAIPVSGIKNVVQNKVYLEGGTTVALKTPEGAFDEKEMAESLIKELNRSGSDSFSFTVDKSGNLLSSGITKSVEDNVVVKVKKIVPTSD